MSLFAEIQSDAGGPLLFDTAGRSCCYVARDGEDETHLVALISDTRTTERPTSDGVRKVTTCEAIIWRDPSSAYGGVAEPKLNASIQLDGELWSITGFTSRSDNFWRIALEKTKQRYKTREEYFGFRK